MLYGLYTLYHYVLFYLFQNKPSNDMIITDITLIDNMAEQIFSHSPNFIAIDMNDYNRIKSSSSYLAATSVKCHASSQLA